MATITMPRILLTACLVLGSASVHAGPAADQFKQDVNAYLAAQAEHPNKVIKYADEQGKVARVALNPARAQVVVSETLEEIHGMDQLKAALDLYKPMAVKYAAAFEQFPGKYDEEYLDSFEVMYQLTLAGMKSLQSMKVEDQDEALRPMLEAAIKMAAAMPALFIKMLESHVEAGKFSPSFVPVVNARIQVLREASQPK